MESPSSSASSSIVHTPRPLIRSLFCGLSDKEIFLIICMIGATIQIAYIIELFFSYEFIIRAHVGVPDETSLPDLSVCFPIIDSINYSKLTSSFPSLFSELHYRPVASETKNFANTLRTKYSDDFILDFFLDRFKINQLWDHMLPVSSIFGKVVTFRVTNDSFVEQPCDSTPFFSEQAWCNSFTCSADDGSSEPMVSRTIDMYKKLTKQEVLSVAVHQKFFSAVNNYWIALTQRGSLPRGQLIKWESQQTYNYTRKHTFFFYSITASMLRSPYDTNCADYTEKGFKSRAEMEDKCQIKLGIERLGSPLPSNTLDGPIDAPFGPDNAQKNATFLTIVNEIVDYCHQIARQPNCNSKIYIPSSRTPLPITGNFTEITVEQISDPVYIIDFGAKLTPLDVLISIGNVLGTWLGFSIASSIPQVVGIVGYKFLKLPITKQKKVLKGSNRISFQEETFVFAPSHLRINNRLNRINNVYLDQRKSHDHWSRGRPYYAYYNQQTWPLFYDAKARPWWLK